MSQTNLPPILPDSEVTLIPAESGGPDMTPDWAKLNRSSKKDNDKKAVNERTAIAGWRSGWIGAACITIQKPFSTSCGSTACSR